MIMIMVCEVVTAYKLIARESTTLLYTSTMVGPFYLFLHSLFFPFACSIIKFKKEKKEKNEKTVINTKYFEENCF